MNMLSNFFDRNKLYLKSAVEYKSLKPQRQPQIEIKQLE